MREFNWFSEDFRGFQMILSSFQGESRNYKEFQIQFISTDSGKFRSVSKGFKSGVYVGIEGLRNISGTFLGYFRNS